MPGHERLTVLRDAQRMAIQEIARLGGEAGVVPGVLLARRLKSLRTEPLRMWKALSR